MALVLIGCRDSIMYGVLLLRIPSCTSTRFLPAMKDSLKGKESVVSFDKGRDLAWPFLLLGLLHRPSKNGRLPCRRRRGIL